MPIHLTSITALLILGALASPVCVALPPPEAQASSPELQPADGRRGKVAYGDTCAQCHGADLNGGTGPALKGPPFAAHWQEQSTDDLFAYISAKMPPSQPGLLDPQTTLDVEAYLLQNNADGFFRPKPSSAAAQGPAAKSKLPAFTPHGGPPNDDAFAQAAVARRREQLARLTPVDGAMLSRAAGADWLTWRGSYANQGYSTLSRIDRTNVGSLSLAWSWALPVSQNEITPLVHDGVMFIASANRVQALDAATGDLLWQYVRPLPPALTNGSQAIVKHLGIYGDKIYYPTPDVHMVALDIKTGAVVWDHALKSGAEDGYMRGGPLLVRGKVIEGMACQRTPGGCRIFALDAETGKEAWRFQTIARPGQPGGDSWNGAPVEERFGGSVWTSGSYDAELNLVYFGIGQTYATSTLLKPHAAKGHSADGLYTDATVALDPDTGRLVWYYQHFNRDVWDFDWVFERTLAELPVEGRVRRVAVTAGKLAIVDVLDRATGQYLFSKDLGLQNLVSAIDPKTGTKIVAPQLAPKFDVSDSICPHGGGARNWPATAYNPVTHILYVPLIESCTDFIRRTRTPAETAAGAVDIGFVLKPRPDGDGNFGRFEAIDLATRKVIWTRRRRAPELAAALATAGGVVFDGTRDRVFRASDDRTGEVLWETRLPVVPSSSPATYSVDGVQYVAVVAGGGGPHDSTWSSLTPEIDNPTGSTTVLVFKLPAARPPP